MKVSICITAYEANRKGPTFIKRCLESCLSQTYKPLQIVVSDHSVDSAVEEECKKHSDPDIELVYTRFEEMRGSPSANWNNAVSFATGEMLRILAMDDYLAYPDAIKDSMNYMENHIESNWFVSYQYNEKNNERYEWHPSWNDNILVKNTLSGPSTVMIKKAMYDKVNMDPQLIYHLDTDWYYRIYEKYGKPGIIPHRTWVNSIHDDQLTYTLYNRYNLEIAMLRKKYGAMLPKSF
jgi:glycosyltransferase involved in cell wall biosynthesis